MTHTFVINDEGLNSYGYWVLNSGIDLSRFEKNPIMLYNHERSGWQREKAMPIGKWENVRIEGTQLLADAVFADHELAQMVADMVEKKILNATSMGFNAIETSEDATMIKYGQYRETVTKCELREVSIVDIPSNPNCVRHELYVDDLVVLSTDEKCPIRELKLKSSGMKKDVVSLLGLDENVSDAVVFAEITKLKQQGGKIKQLTAEIATLKKAAKKSEVAELVEKAKGCGLVGGQLAWFETLADKDQGSAKEYLSTLGDYKPLSTQVKEKKAAGGNAKVVKTDADKFIELDKAGKLGELMADDMEEFERLQAAHTAYMKKTGVIR